MSFFWFIFPLLVFFFAYFGDESKTKNQEVSKYSRVLLWLTLSTVLATCGSVYTDHATYHDFYYYFSKTRGIEFSNVGELFLVKNPGLDSPVENGFAFLVWIIGKLGFSHIGFFFIIGGITNLFIIKAFYRFRYPAIVFLLYILSVHYQQEFNLIRQMMVVAVAFYSLKYIEESNWKKYLLFLIVAFLFHQTSIILLTFLPLCFVKDYSKFWKTAKIVLSVLFAFSVLVALRKIPFDLTWITMYFDLYAGYVSNEDQIGVGDQSINLLYNFIVLLTLLLYKKENSRLIYVIFMILGCIISNVAVQTPNLNRIALYFSIAYVPLVPSLLGDGYLFKKKSTSKLSLGLYVLFSCSVILKFIFVGNNIIGSKIENIFNFFI